MKNCTKGILLPTERKSVEPMAARLAPGNVRPMNQSLHRVVADAIGSDDAVLKQTRKGPDIAAYYGPRRVRWRDGRYEYSPPPEAASPALSLYSQRRSLPA